MDQVQLIQLAKLSSHPQNPRIILREDVVESIRRQLEEARAFPVEHALLVQPVDDGYRIVCGHNRTEAAKRAGLKEVPCWVREMSDEEAFMQLVLSNAQGELSPLEVGLHALRAVPLAEGGRGKKGGLTEYATRIGRDKGNVSRYRDGAEVFEAIRNCCNDTTVFLDKAQHLAAIHQADRRAWPALVAALLSKDWSVKDAENRVARVREFAISERWETVFLPYDKVVERFLADEFSPRTVAHLCAQADLVLSTIERLPSAEATAARDEFLAWLRAGVGGAAWDSRQVARKQKEYEACLEAAEEEIGSSWLRGDWREHVKKLTDSSVHLLLTDPPYGVALQSGYRKEKHAKILGDGAAEASTNLRDLARAIFRKMAADSHVLCFCSWRNEPASRAALEAAGFEVRGSLVWVKNATSMGDLDGSFAPKHERILHAVKGSPVLYVRDPDVLEADRVASDDHPTEKPVALLERLIRATTVEGHLVADPFGGVASTLVAARSCGRRFWGCEVEEGYYKKGKNRISV